jgi:hypothetical protein
MEQYLSQFGKYSKRAHTAYGDILVGGMDSFKLWEYGLITTAGEAELQHVKHASFTQQHAAQKAG